jgi:hypothetical protein
MVFIRILLYPVIAERDDGKALCCLQSSPILRFTGPRDSHASRPCAFSQPGPAQMHLGWGVDFNTYL